MVGNVSNKHIKVEDYYEKSIITGFSGSSSIITRSM
jgi:hypothetical protein